MFDIPAGARHILIEENVTSPHIIGEFFFIFDQRRIAKVIAKYGIPSPLCMISSGSFLCVFVASAGS